MLSKFTPGRIIVDCARERCASATDAFRRAAHCIFGYRDSAKSASILEPHLWG
jgi:hypothetical protein